MLEKINKKLFILFIPLMVVSCKTMNELPQKSNIQNTRNDLAILKDNQSRVDSNSLEFFLPEYKNDTQSIEGITVDIDKNNMMLLTGLKHIPPKLQEDLQIKALFNNTLNLYTNKIISLQGYSIDNIQVLIRGDLKLPKELYIEYRGEKYRTEFIYGKAHMPEIQGYNNNRRRGDEGDYFFVKDKTTYKFIDGEMVLVNFPSFSKEHKEWQLEIIESIRHFKNSPYNTSIQGQDYGITPHIKNHHYNYMDYYTGSITQTDEPPRVCTDLITFVIDALEDGENVNSSYYNFKGSSEAAVSSFESYTQNEKKFETIPVFSNDLDSLPKMYPGDIITMDHHMGIVTKVDENGFPTLCIEATRRGVTEVPFWDEDAFEEFFPDGRVIPICFFRPHLGINYIVRPTQKYCEEILRKLN